METLTSMGFSEDASRTALRECNGNLSNAYDFIRRAKWNIKPYGKKLGYCDDLENALNYAIKSGLKFDIKYLNEQFLSHCN